MHRTCTPVHEYSFSYVCIICMYVMYINQIRIVQLVTVQYAYTAMHVYDSYTCTCVTMHTYKK